MIYNLKFKNIMTKKYHAYTRPITSSEPVLGASDCYSQFKTYSKEQGIEICINHIDVISFYIQDKPLSSKGAFNSLSSLVDAINYGCKKLLAAELVENYIHISSNHIFEIIDTNITSSFIQLIGIHYDEQDI